METTPNFLIQLNETHYQTPDISKKGVAKAANNLYTQIMDGNMSAIDVAVMIKFVDETAKQLKELTDEVGRNSFTDLVREEVKSNSDDGKSYMTKYGVKFELYEAATKHDYEACGDPVWNRLNNEVEILKAKLKERESFLKTLSKPITMNVLDADTAEIHENVQLYPPAKSSTSTYKQTLITG